MKIISKTF